MRWFTRYWAVYRHELQKLHIQPNTYIFLTFAWIGMVLCTFYLGGFFARNEAGMNVFFAFQPWIYLFLIPALSMGIWSEEWRQGSAERLLTLPINPFWLTLAKFKALLTLFLVTLLGTFPMLATIYWLGDPALGPILTGYLGCFLAGAAMLAISLFASQFSRSQAGGFVLGVLMLFVWLASGWGLLTSLLEGFLPQAVIDVLIRFSLLDRFRNFNEGLVDLRDVVFFLSLAIGFALLTHLLLVARERFTRALGFMALVIAGVGGLNWAVQPLLVQLDATTEQVHTLDPHSIAFIKSIKHPVTITLYFSSDNKDLPVPVIQFARRVEDKLKDITRLNPDYLSFKIEVPERDTDIEDLAQERGMQEVLLPSGNAYYFGLAVNGMGRGTRLPAMNPLRQDFLEFDIMSALTELMKTSRQKVGILTELNLGDDQLRPKFVQDLLDTYDVTILKPGEPEFPGDLDLIMVFMTPFFDQETLYALDQYLVNGGRVLMTLDPFLRSAPTAEFQAPDRNADAWGFDHPADLLRSWGVEYDYNQVVADPNVAMPVTLPGIGTTPYPLWLALEPRDINYNVPVNANIETLLLAESGFFTPKKVAEDLTYEPLLTSTDQAQTVTRTMFIGSSPHLIASQISGQKKKRDLAFMLSGRFSSTFDDVSPAAKQFYIDFAEDPTKVKFPTHHKKTDKEGALLVLGDLDFISDEYALVTDRRMGEMVQEIANDNLGFFYNSIQYLLGDSVLLPIRGKAQDHRRFTRLDDMMRNVTVKYQKIEQELVAELFHIAQRLQTLHQRAEKQQQIDAAIQEEIRAFQREELDVKKRLRRVQQTLRQDVDALERALAIINLLTVPILVWGYAVMLFTMRRRKARKALQK